MKRRLQAWGDTKIINIVGAFVFDEDGKLLLLQRHSEDLGGGKWGTPGGRIDDGETAEKAMKREFYEETGIRNVNLELLGTHNISMPHGAVHMTSYKVVLPSASKINLDPDEHHDFKWFKTSDLLKEHNILWGIPSILRDFSLLNDFQLDPTLTDGSSVKLLDLVK